MNTQFIIDQTVAFVREELKNAEGGHDWWHIQRVWHTARFICQTEKADALVVDLAALLHDIADAKFHGGNEEVGPAKAKKFLTQLGVGERCINHVVLIIKHISFKGGNFTQAFHSPELAIVQDADRLDALGAIGIARAFNYGGFKNRELYNPEILPQLNMTSEEYKKSTTPTINHFYEKLLLLKDRMNTLTGKALAIERHQFMETFLEQFYAEWKGER